MDPNWKGPDQNWNGPDQSGLEKRLRFPAALATVAKVVRCCKQDGKHFGLMKGDKVQAWRLHPWLDS